MTAAFVAVAWVALVVSAIVAWYALSKLGAPDARETYPRGERR